MSYLIRFHGLLGAGLVIGLAACGDDGFVCGDNTELVDGECLPSEMICATGTEFNETTRRCEGTPDTGATCGTGTVQMGDECVPTGETVECGTGTTLMGDECVPDGTMICADNTIFDMATGTCVVDPDAICEGGAVFVESSSSCVDSDSLLEAMADYRELMEPNDPAYNEMGMPQMVDLPASGTTSVWGCIRPTDFDEDGVVDGDLDYFAVEIAEAGTVLDVTIDGTGGLSAGVAFFNIDDDFTAAGWERDIVNLSSDGATGKVFFPEAGTYYMAAFDSRFLLSGAPAGSETPDTTCYFMQVGIGADLTPVAIMPGTPVMGTFGEPALYRMTASANQVIFGSLEELNAEGDSEDREPIVGTFVQVVESQFRGNAEVDANGPAFNILANATMGDEIWFVVDYRLNLSFDEIEYRFEVNAPAAQEIPDDGDVAVTHIDNPDGNLDSLVYFHFDVAANDIAHLTFDGGGDDFLALLIRPDGTGLVLHQQDLFGAIPLQTFDEYFQFDQTGTHYIGILNADAMIMGGDAYTVGWTKTIITPMESMRGMASALDLATDDAAFFGADLQAADWLRFESSNETDFDGAIVQFYPRGEFGRLDVDLPATDFARLGNGSSFQRIPLGDGANHLVRVDEDGTVAGTETFDITISDVPFTDLGTLTMDVMRSADMVAAGDEARYVMRAEPLATINTLVTPVSTGFDAVLSLLDSNGEPTEVIDDTGPDLTETSSATIAGTGATIFTVADSSGAAGTFDLDFTLIDPPYDHEGDSGVVFTSICPDDGGMGTTETLTGDVDDGQLATLADISASGFLFFGAPTTTLQVFTNGWLTFADHMPTGFAQTMLGNAGTETLDAVAPLALDLTNVRICTLIEAESVTVQWDGVTFAAARKPVQMQAILRSNSRIDFVYGPNHSATIGGGDIGGPWDPGPFVGLQRGSDGAQLGVPPVMPGQSLTLTPN